MLWTVNTERYSNVVAGLNDTITLCVIVAHLNCQLQTTQVSAQWWHEPLCATSHRVQGDLQEQRGGRHGHQLSHPLNNPITSSWSRSVRQIDFVQTSESSKHARLCLLDTHRFFLLQYIPYVGDSKKAMDEYTPLRSSWAARTTSCCTTAVKIHSSPRPSSLTWCSTAPGWAQNSDSAQSRRPGNRWWNWINLCFHCIAYMLLFLMCQETLSSLDNVIPLALCKTSSIPLFSFFRIEYHDCFVVY